MGYDFMKVYLNDSVFKNSQEIGKEVLFRLSADRLLAPFYEAMGKEPKAKRYGGWESMQISGHSLGHYMSALALCYETTDSEIAKEKAEYVINELSSLQQENGYICGFPEKESFGEVFSHPDDFRAEGFNLGGWWVPYYTLHKILRGLIDIYEKIGTERALEIVKKSGIWVYETLSSLTQEQRKRVLICEYGGMNFVLSRLYRITGDERFRKASCFFCEDELIVPLSENKDILTGKHANTQIPKLSGAMEMYENGGEQYLFDGAKNFFCMVSENRSYAIGGNSVSEHFHDLDAEPLEHNTCETCNSNNMLTLAKQLFSFEKTSDYYNYCEKVIYNHILASQDEEGMKTYFVSLKSGHFKVYSTLEDSFWCCFGSGLENPFTYNQHIFHETEKELYVNLYISSSAQSEDFSLSLESGYPYSENATLTFHSDNSKEIYLRKPFWCDDFRVEYKNSGYANTENGYVKIKGDFKKGESITINFPMKTEIYKKRDDENQVYFTYGGIVLAERLGKENFPESDHAKDQNELKDCPCISVKPINSTEIIKTGSLEFQVDGKVLEPFYDILHERYRVYFEIKDKR